jgi:hypothetical protein
MAKAPYFNHSKYLVTREPPKMGDIHDAARAMNAIQRERMKLLSLGSEVRVHRPAPGAPLKERRVKNAETGVWEWVAV